MPFRVFLNPDGTHPAGLAIIVMAPTGVRYGTQCGGLTNETREAEGFLVLSPARDFTFGSHNIETELQVWFAARYPNGEPGSSWASEHVAELATIVARVVCWFVDVDGESQRGHCELDLARIDQACEAWIPVSTPIGRGILTFDNSD